MLDFTLDPLSFIPHPSSLILSSFLSALWSVAALQDWRARRITRPVLLALVLVSLWGTSWWWWIALGLAVAWPLAWRRAASGLGLASAGLGWAVGQPAPGLGLGAGALAWAWGWWGGGDALLLAALCVRHSLPGLVCAAAAMIVSGLGVMVARQQRPIPRLALAAGEALRRSPAPLAEGNQTGVPADAEMPAVLPLSVTAIVLEGWVVSFQLSAISYLWRGA